MPIVFIPATLRACCGGRDHIEVPIVGSVRRVFEELETQCPGFGEQVLLDGELRPGLAIFVDEELAPEGLIQRVSKDGTIRILAAMGGGATG